MLTLFCADNSSWSYYDLLISHYYIIYMFTRLILFLIFKCSLHPPPLHRQTATQKSCSQTPLKSGQGWPALLYCYSRAPQWKQQQLFRGPRPEKPLNRWKYYSYMLCYKCTVMVGNKFLLTYLLTHLLIYVYFWIPILGEF